jgi:hypothetical protein
VYTGLRVLLLLGVGGLLYLTGARGFLLILLAFLVSGALSLVWLDRPRGQMSAGFGRVMGRMNAKIDEAAAKEDHLQPALRAEFAEEGPTRSAEDEADTQPEAGQQQGK